MHTQNGAQIIIRQLEQLGVDTIAGIPGGANLPLYDALAASTTIRHVLARHEQGAGFIAQGIARTTGKPAGCFATSGPGATNVLTALADAYLAVGVQVPTIHARDLEQGFLWLRDFGDQL